MNLKTIFFFCFLFFTLLANNWSLVSEDPLLNYDDNIVVAPMEKITSLNDYFSKINTGEIFDRQPVRDLSFWFDFQIKKHFSIPFHHFHNLMIWFLISVSLFYILIYTNISRRIAAFMVTLFAFHPCLTNALSWVTARKHLLSAFFILLATLIIVRILKPQDKSRSSDLEADSPFSFWAIISISFLYLFSSFSQPINIAWPLWVFSFYYFHTLNAHKGIDWIFFDDPNRFQSRLFFSLLALILLFVFLINNHYYEGTYLIQSGGVGKYISPEENLLSYKILALGASVFQAFIPLWPTPSSYYPGSAKNLIGMLILILSLYALIKFSLKEKRKDLLVWVLFALLPLAVIILKMTNIFGSDTYLIIPVAGLYIIISNLISHYQSSFITRFKYFSLVGISLVLSFIFLSHEVSQSWSSDKKLWILAEKNEPTPVVIRNLANAYYNEKQFDLSFQFAHQLIEWSPSTRDADLIYAKSLYGNHNIPSSQKILLFKKGLEFIPDSIWLKYYFSSFMAGQNQWIEAYTLMKNIPIDHFKLFKQDLKKILKDYIVLCMRASMDVKNSCLTEAHNIESFDQNKFKNSFSN